MHLQYNNTYFDVIRRILYNEVEDMYSYDSAMLAAVAGMLGVIVVAMIVWIIIAVIANWRIFTKAGEDGWKCLIPFYNQYVRFGFTWDTTYFWVVLGIAVVGSIITALKIPVTVSLTFLLLTSVHLWVLCNPFIDSAIIASYIVSFRKLRITIPHYTQIMREQSHSRIIITSFKLFVQ